MHGVPERESLRGDNPKQEQTLFRLPQESETIEPARADTEVFAESLAYMGPVDGPR
jgi:hypothetical protein